MNQPTPPVSQQEYRALTGHLTLSTAVLSVSHRSNLRAITVTSFMDVSYDPPTMAVAVYEGSRMSDALSMADTMTLSVLAAGQKHIAQWLGQPGQPEYGLLTQIPFVDGTAGPAHVEGCATWFEMRIVKCLTVATHEVSFGQVVACGGSATASPLLYQGGDYPSLGGL